MKKITNNEKEIWKTLPGVAGVEVSTFGRVRTLDKMVWNGKVTYLKKGRVLKQHKNNRGYLLVRIPIDEKRATKTVHRLVAKAFIKNTDNLPEVNHKDCDRTNNNVDNLEWCTHQENVAYRDKLGHTARNNAPKSPVYAIDLVTLEVSRYQSQSEASRKLGVFQQSISKVIKGKGNQAGGFWFVKDDGHAVDVVKSKLHDVGGVGLKIK